MKSDVEFVIRVQPSPYTDDVWIVVPYRLMGQDHLPECLKRAMEEMQATKVEGEPYVELSPAPPREQ